MYARVDVRVCSSNKNVRYERRLREDLSFVLHFSFLYLVNWRYKIGLYKYDFYYIKLK